ncbi:restriction endonuclease subunit S [Methylosoma difficile]
MIDLITQHMDIWTSAQLTKSTAGRGNSGKQTAYGIKKLRELILELAVRGKLVPQDPNDEPASVLLEKIAEEKARLVKEGVIKDQKSTLEINEIEMISLPNKWKLCRLGTLFNALLSGGTPSKNNPEYWGGNIPWASVKDLGQSKYIEKTQDYITDAGLAAGSKLADIGDILICTRMGLGKIAICKNQIAINQDLKAVKLSSQINLDYFLTVFSTFNIKGTGTTVAGIKQDELLNFLFPLPPLAEQHRIVAKVDELMALCDQLERQQTDNHAAHQTLVETLLGALIAEDGATANNAEAMSGYPSQDGFAATWQRIAEHFDTLFTTEHSIDQLKQTILQLAVMGKLVPQDPNDEPASVLLEKIAEEKARLVKEGKIKKLNSLPKITDGEKAFTIPKMWEWVRLGYALKKITDGTHHSPPNGDEGDFLYISAKNIKAEGVMLSNATYVSKEVHQEIYSRCDPEYGDILYIKDGATTGIATINNLEMPFSMLSSVALLKVPNGILNTYLLLSLKSPYFYNEMRLGMTGVAITRVTLSKLDNAVISLPPLAEQYRIVAKVDELMALCDALKARIKLAQTTQIQLADVIVEQAAA